MALGLRRDHVSLLATAYVRHALRTGTGIVYLLVFLVCGLGIASTFSDSLNSAGNYLGDEASMMWEVLRPVVAWWVDGPHANEVTQHLLTARPPTMSVFLVILLAFTPFTACLAGFNQTAGEIGDRGLRYFLTRTERANILIARFLAVVLFSAVAMLALVLLVAVVLATTTPDASIGANIAWGLQGWLALVFISLPYLALSAWISASLDSGAASLTISLLVVSLSVGFINAFQSAFRNGGDWLDLLTPWGWKYGLLGPDWGRAVLSAGVLLVFTALFLGLALRIFRRRDL